MKNINVFQDDDANYCYIVGTSDPKEAEEALRKQENIWYGDDERKWDASIGEKRMSFDDFSATDFYIRGERISTEKEELQGRGRIAKREGFIAPLN